MTVLCLFTAEHQDVNRVFSVSSSVSEGMCGVCESTGRELFQIQYKRHSRKYQRDFIRTVGIIRYSNGFGTISSGCRGY